MGEGFLKQKCGKYKRNRTGRAHKKTLIQNAGNNERMSAIMLTEVILRARRKKGDATGGYSTFHSSTMKKALE
jgi:hypothetical protein